MFSSDILLIYYSLNWLFLSHFVKFKHFWASSCFCFGFSQCSFLWHTKPKTLNSSSRKKEKDSLFAQTEWLELCFFANKISEPILTRMNCVCRKTLRPLFKQNKIKKTFLKPSTRMSSFTITRLKFPKYIFLCCS